MKAAKFLIAENPIVDDGRVFVIHMRNPVIIAEAFHFSLDQEAEWMESKSRFEIGASVGYPGELIVLGAIFVAEFKGEKYESTSKDVLGTGKREQDSEYAPPLSKIMSRMGDWYHNYLKWEDEKEI